MGRHPHNSAGAVAHEDIVAHQDGNLFTVDRVYGMAAGKETNFLCFGGGPVNLAFHSYLPDKIPNFLFLGLTGDQLLDQGVLRSQDHVGYSKKGIRPGSKNGQLISCFLYGKDYIRTVAAADPVFLHCFNPFGPSLQELQVFQQAIGISGNFQEPLLQFGGGYFSAAAPAPAVNNLLVGQHRLA